MKKSHYKLNTTVSETMPPLVFAKSRKCADTNIPSVEWLVNKGINCVPGDCHNGSVEQSVSHSQQMCRWSIRALTVSLVTATMAVLSSQSLPADVSLVNKGINCVPGDCHNGSVEQSLPADVSLVNKGINCVPGDCHNGSVEQSVTPSRCVAGQ